MKKSVILFFACIVSSLFAPQFAQAQTQSQDSQPTAVSWQSIYKASLLNGKIEGQENLHGAHGNLDLKLTVDGGKAWGIPGSELFLYALHNHGNQLNQRLGTIQGIDNIEATTNTLLYQFWYQQRLLDDRLSLLTGLYDLNSEFYATSASGLFLLPPFGIGTDLAQTGENGPSIFPVTSLSARIKWQPAPAYYWQAALLDGIAGDPDQPRGTQVRLNKGDGVLQISEAGYSPDASTKFGIGAWRYSTRVDDLIDTDANGDAVKRRDKGWYALMEGTLFRDATNPDRRVNAFLRYGMANAEANHTKSAFNAGLTFDGVFSDRPDDVLGLGVAVAHFGSRFRQASRDAGEPAPHSEISWELTYRAKITDNVSFQPVFQHIKSTGDDRLKNINVIGLRFEVGFGSE